MFLSEMEKIAYAGTWVNYSCCVSLVHLTWIKCVQKLTGTCKLLIFTDLVHKPYLGGLRQREKHTKSEMAVFKKPAHPLLI